MAVKKGEVFGNGVASDVNPLPEPIMMACYYNYSPDVVAALLDAGRAVAARPSPLGRRHSFPNQLNLGCLVKVYGIPVYPYTLAVSSSLAIHSSPFQLR